MNKIIDFQEVSVVYPNGKRALNKVSFSIAAGECLALVGESGCGKSTLARAALGILPPNTKISGSISLSGRETVGAAAKLLRSLRGLVVGFISQDPFAACNPLATVGDFVAEAWRVHSLFPPQKEIINSLENIGIENPKTKVFQFPHQWSGGMLQRAGLAAAAAHSPLVIVADEPTSSLDQELNEVVLNSLRKSANALLLISHDVRAVEKFADRVAVMKNGEIIEIGAAKTIFQSPQAEYTRELLTVHSALETPSKPVSATAQAVLTAANLTHFYEQIEIVKNLDFQLRSGEIVGIYGASGGGKSTLLRLLATIETPRQGDVYLGGELAASGKTARLLSSNARNGFVMPIFQDSFASLNPRWTIWRIITEPLTVRRTKQNLSKNERREIAREKLREVNLENINLDARPNELSLGQCQRVAIARAVTAEAKIIAADEPTSSLDSANGERIMTLFARAAARGAAVIIVSHQQDLLKRWCHRVYRLAHGVLEI